MRHRGLHDFRKPAWATVDILYGDISPNHPRGPDRVGPPCGSVRQNKPPKPHVSESDVTAAERIFCTVTVTVGSLYIATHSITMTMVGTIASTIVACRGAWLLQRRQRSMSMAVHRMAGQRAGGLGSGASDA
jgi:hypothetical protein